jgi:hypothetical protein
MYDGTVGWLSDLLTGGDGELGWDDLIRRVVDEIAALRRYGARGEVVLPPEVTVRITVGEGSVATVKELVDRPELDREVAAALANRCDVPLEQLPHREYVVSAADRTSVTISEAAPRAWQIAIAGGDRDGQALALPERWSEVTFGRGAENDLVVCEKTQFVSRRAGRLVRAGHQIEVHALDQGDLLVVRRADGDTVRPARTARGCVAIRGGDAIELGDGRGGIITLSIKR